MRYLQAFILGAVIILAIGLIQKAQHGQGALSQQSLTQSDQTEPGRTTIPARTGSEDANTQRRIEERDRLRQEAAEANSQDFGLLRYRTDLSGSAPVACLVFSSALDESADYSAFVTSEPRTPLSLTPNGRELCIGGLSFSENRSLILRAGLPAADGRELEEREQLPIDFTDRPPYVGFKGSGVILPRLDADGLPIETVNVDRVKIEVTRVNDRALAFKRVMEGVTRAQGGYGYLYGDESPSDVESDVWSGEMEIETVQNAPVVTSFPLERMVGELQPGAYFVTVTDAREDLGRNGPPAEARRWIITTDLALTSYRGETGLDVVVRSLQTARRVGSVELQLIAQNNEILATRTTDGTRTVRFENALMEGRGNLRPRMIVAFGSNGDFAMLDLDRAPIDLSSDSVGGRTPNYPVDGFAYTERGIYRPGETVYVTAMLRDDAGRAVTDRTGRLVVYRPNGMEAARLPFDETQLGGVSEAYTLPKAAARGMWRIAVEVDGLADPVANVSVSVEDFVPQRIAVELDADTDIPLQRGEVRDIEVNARFLYGAPGAGLTVQSEARMEIDRNPFENFEGFRFGEYDEVFRQEIIEFPETVTDGAGRVTLPLNPGTRGQRASQPLRLRTVVSVLEPGGRAVSESTIIPFRPKASYLGVKPQFDRSPSRSEAIAFDVANISPEGEALAANLDWRLIQVYYTYDWYQEGSRWRWRRSRYVKTINEGDLRLSAGETGTITSDALEDYGDYRLIVENAETSDETSHQFWVGWGGRAQEGVDAPDRVRLSVAEDAPETGERARLTLLPPYAGEAQIVVATDRVLSVSYQSVSEEGTELALPVSSDWGEGAYVMVTVFSPRDAIAQPKPRRAVGVAYVPVDTSDRTFDVAFDAPELIRPRTEQTIEVTLSDGPREPVFLTLAAVDEGILQLTKYRTPDPVSHYFGKTALGVDIYDDYGRLLDPNLAAPGETRSGGDSIGGEGLSVVPTKTVSLFSGLVDVGRDGKAEVSFDVPDFNGELRLMAVAWSANGVGSGDQALTVRDEVPVELSLPRFLAPGDTAFATVSIDNVEGDAGTFNADFTAAGPVNFVTTEVAAELPQGARGDAPVRLNAVEEGISDLSVSVAGPGGFEIARSYPIQSRSAFLPETRIERTQLAANASYAVPAGILSGFIPGSEEVVVSFSPLPLDTGTLYASLSRYPYGCTEQIASRALPLLYAENLAAVSGAGSDDAAASAKRQVQEAVDTLLNRQSPDGAIGLWREGDRNASPWLGAYATDFLYRAKEAGYVVPNAALSRAYTALSNVSQGEAWRVYGYDTDVWESRWHSDTQEKLMKRSAPYALYVLAKAGRADVSRLRYMHDRELRSIQSPLARAHLGAALAFMGDRSRAVSAFESAMDAVGYRNDGDYYQTPVRDLAGVLALAAEANLADQVDGLSDRLARDLPDQTTLTTQEKAFLLVASDAVMAGQPELQIASEMDGEANRYLMTADEATSGATFQNAGQSPIWQTTMVRGAPQTAPPASSSRMSIEKTIYTYTGERADLTRVSQGDRLVIRLSLTPEERRTNPMIVEDLLPAGFEIEAVLRPSDGASGEGAFSWLGDLHSVKIAESRDDRFVAAIDVRDNQRSMAYVVRAVTPGDFVLPGAVTEDMYRPNVFARSPSTRVTIEGDAG